MVKKIKKFVTMLLLTCIVITVFFAFDSKEVEASVWTNPETFWEIYGDTPTPHDNCIYVCKRASTASGTGYRIFTLGLRLNITGTSYYVDLALEKGYSNGTSITLAGSSGQVKLIDEVENDDDGYTYSLYKINYNELLAVIYERLGEDVVSEYFTNTSDDELDVKLQIDSIMTAIYWNSSSSYDLKCDIKKCTTSTTTFTTSNHYTSTSTFKEYYTKLNSSTTITFSELFDFDFTYTLSAGAGVYPTYVSYYVYNYDTGEYEYWKKITKNSYTYGKTVTQDTSAPDGYITTKYDNKKYTISFDWKYYYDAYSLSCDYDEDSVYQSWVLNGQSKIKICDTVTKVYLKEITAPTLTTEDKEIDEASEITNEWLLENVTATDDIDGDVTDSVTIIDYGGLEDCIGFAKAGTYTVTYSVTNSNDLTTTETATITVNNILPTITAENKEIDYGEEITDEWLLEDVTAEDVYDGDLTDSVTIVDYGGLEVGSTENAHTLFTVTYSVTDSNNGTTTTTAAIQIVYRYVRAISLEALDSLNTNSKWATGSLYTELVEVLNKVETDDTTEYEEVWTFDNEDRITIQTYMTENAPSEDTNEWFLDNYSDNKIWDIDEQ